MKMNRKFALMFLVVLFVLSFAFEVSARGGGGGGRGGHGRGGGRSAFPIFESSESVYKTYSYALLRMKENSPYVLFSEEPYYSSRSSKNNKLYFEDKGDYWLLNGNIPKGTFLKVPLGYKVRCNSFHTESGNEFSKKKAGNGRVIYSGETTVKYIQSSGLEVLKK